MSAHIRTWAYMTKHAYLSNPKAAQTANRETLHPFACMQEEARRIAFRPTGHAVGTVKANCTTHMYIQAYGRFECKAPVSQATDSVNAMFVYLSTGLSWAGL